MNRDEYLTAAAEYLDGLERIRTGAQLDISPPIVPAVVVCHIDGCAWSGQRVPIQGAPNWDGDWRMFCPSMHPVTDITLIHSDGLETIGGEFVPLAVKGQPAANYRYHPAKPEEKAK